MYHFFQEAHFHLNTVFFRSFIVGAVLYNRLNRDAAGVYTLPCMSCIRLNGSA